MKLKILNTFGLLSLLSSPALEARGSKPVNTATYRVTFVATWDKETHPTNFPSNPHFSGLVGATHQDGTEIWRTGGIASEGIEVMAETGSKRPLLREVDQLIDDDLAEFALSGGGIPSSPGVQSLEFDISSQHSTVSLVSMLAPSPDWFVGVSSLQLLENGEWISSKEINLALYDAGTDDGNRFTSRDIDSVPRQPISRLTSDPRDTDFENGKAYVGKFIFERIDD